MGCEEKGPAERAGERVDNAVNQTIDNLDPRGPAEKAGAKLDKAADDAAEAVNPN
jgi:hypothetical protein